MTPDDLSIGARGPLGPGTMIGSYRVEAPLGEGGMGTVYRATDTKLNRPVAIKVLSDNVADAAARRRFQREAQMASSLNHPHILTVYDAGEFEGRQYLVTEFVDGGTLKDWAKAEKRTWRQVVELLTGVADGLAAAHAAGITHRDIKPANILVAKNGYAKLADFGLAKLMEDADADATRTLTEGRTRPGAVVGTIAYMSPEQACGQRLDGRSDVFSFGIVLYEMLAGKRPFRGKSDLETLKTIIHGDPDHLPAETPAALHEIIVKALEKDPAERYQSMRELVVDLRRAVHKKPRALSSAAAPQRRVSPWPWVVAAVALGVAALAWFARQPVPRNPLANATFTRLMATPETELDAGISPDGQFVAYLSNRDGAFSVWVNQIGVREARNLTPDLGDIRGPLRSLGFTRDGSEIWLRGTETQKVRLLPLVGGVARPFLAEHVVAPVWSPDGEQMSYHELETGDPMFVADADGSDPRQIHGDGPDIHNHYLAWGKDGEWIYYVHGIQAARELDLWRIRKSGGEPERLTQHNSDMRDPTPLDQNTVLYVAKNSSGAGPWLWALDLKSKTSTRLTLGLETYTSLSASENGRRLAATVANPEISLWTVPLAAGTRENDAKRYDLPSVKASVPRIRGEAVYYVSSAGSEDGLWRFQGGRSTEIWRGTQGALTVAPAVSPDGKQIAVSILRERRRELTLISADGSETRALAPGIDVQGSADWSPDGQWIVTGGKDANGEGLFKIPVAGGAPERLASTIGRNPVWSPDGSKIAYMGPNVYIFSQLVVIRPDGSPVTIPQVRLDRDGERMRFLPDGRLVYMQQPEEAAVPWHDFWLLDFATMRPHRLTELSGRATMRTFDVTPDGKQILFDRLEENSDIVVIDLPESK